MCILTQKQYDEMIRMLSNINKKITIREDDMIKIIEKVKLNGKEKENNYKKESI